MDVLGGGRCRPWTRNEVGAAVAAYLDMLRSELRGLPYVKSDIVRDLQPLIPERSRPSIERWLQSISAVLDEGGIDWVDDYVPLAYYRHDLTGTTSPTSCLCARSGRSMTVSVAERA